MDLRTKLAPHNIKYLLNRLIRGKGEIDDIADKRIEISPAIKSTIRPSFYFESELRNILKFHPETSEKNEMLRIKGGEIVHDATFCWQIKNAYLLDGAVYKNNFKKVFPSKTSQPNDNFINDDGKNELALASSYQGIKYFGHWLRDDVVTYMAAQQFGIPISLATDNWPDKTIYASLFEQDWHQHFNGKVKTLSVFQDYAQNDYRVARYQALRSLLRQKFNAIHDGNYIYLKRGLTGANIRNLVNEEQLIETLKKQNFIILDLTSHSLEHIIEQLLDAKLVVTLEGSHQNHALYTLADKGNLIIIQPPDLFNNSAKDWCDALDFSHGITIGNAKENGFEVNLDNVIKLIEKMKI